MKTLHRSQAFLLLVALSACSFEKTEHPLSPTVAGPIPGVAITAPRTLAPADNEPIAVNRQPVTLSLENAESSGVRPLTYSFEVATDVNFTNRVFARENIQPGDDNRTNVQLPDALATGRTYYWRAKAQDGANAGPYSSWAFFRVYTPIVIGAPVLVAPVNNVRVADLRPSFVIANAPRSGPAGPISYVVEVSETMAFGQKVAVWIIQEQAGQTALTTPGELAPNHQYFWRALAYDPTTTGQYSEIQAFQTPQGTPTGPNPTPGGCTSGATPFETLQCLRPQYPDHMSQANKGSLLNRVAWQHRGEGWGMHAKSNGNFCPQPGSGTGISCDILVDGRTGGVYDVLADETTPVWGYKGPINTMANFVPPVAP